jgi:hypothetical protein
MSTEMKAKTPAISALAEIEKSRAVQEAQGAILVAHRFPRDENLAREKIMKACQRPEFAATAAYAFPRGDTTVTGPSIRLAETIQRAWGNMQSGIRELSRTANESEAQAYAIDLETNTRYEKSFRVPHLRYTKNGSYRLTDPRDIYEAVANQGARRERACILKAIPQDIIDDAIAECDKTLAKTQEPLDERIKKMVEAFAKVNVSAKDIETKLRKKLEAFTPADMKSIGRVLLTIQDGMAKPEDYFGVREAKAAGAQAAREAAAKAAGRPGEKKPGIVSRLFGGTEASPQPDAVPPGDEEGAELAFDSEEPEREPGEE